MSKVGVYKISSTLDDRVYIGSSNNIERRWKEHRRDLKSGVHKNAHLQRFYSKYGDCLKYEVLCECHKNELLVFEQMYLDSGYELFNCSSIAGRVEMTEEVRKKIGNRLRGRKLPQWQKDLISRTNMGNYKGTTAQLEAAKANGRKSKPPKECVVGSGNPQSKLNESQVREIKSLLTYTEISGVELADNYNVSPHCISKINTNQSWKHVPWPKESKHASN